MPVSEKTIKRLYAKSGNQCAMPQCDAPIILKDIPVGEICHIEARNKKGPRYNPILTAKEKDDFSNLVLLCRTCHKIIDSDEKTYSVELLKEIKEMHERKGNSEITEKVARQSVLLLKQNKSTKASAKNNSVAISIGGDSNAPISVSNTQAKTQRSKYPKNAIGSDAYMAGYIEYLFGKAIDYWKNVPNMVPGRLGSKVKRRFSLKSRTMYHIPIDKFERLADYITHELIASSPAGKRHLRNGTKMFKTFEEWKKL